MKSSMRCLIFAGITASLAAAVSVNQDVASPPDPTKVSLPSVPAVASVGKNGYPELPTISSIMDESDKTLSGINDRATRLQLQMSEVQKENSLRLQHQKVVFDKKLKEQEEKNVEVVQENAKIAKQIMELKKDNEALLGKAQGLQKGNAMRQRELKMIQEELAASETFVKEAMEKNDDSKAPELTVLNEEDKAAAAEPVSFLTIDEAVSQEVEPAEEKTDDISSILKEKEKKTAKKTDDAESILNYLSNGVQALKKQGQDSEKKLKQLFLADFQAGVKRHKALLSQKEVLNSTLSNMQAYHEKLAAADKHLKATQKEMDSKLKEGGLFLQKLGQVTLGKPEEAVKTFEGLAAKSEEKK